MKKLGLFFIVIATLLTGVSMGATAISPYKCDFERTIHTSNHAFKVASNWQHIVGTTTDDDEVSYMNYSYNTESGYNGSACLYAGSGQSFTDYLVTPLVKGAVSLRVKLGDVSSSYVEVYEAGSDGACGSLITTINGSYIKSKAGVSDLDTQTWYQVVLPSGLQSYQRLYLHCNQIYLDDFEAEFADITPEASMSIESAVPSDTAGLIHWDQQPNGNVLIDYVVTVKNDGDVTLTPGTEGYSITVFDNQSGVDIFTVNVPVTLAAGETSEEFHVSAEVNPSDVWTTNQRFLYLRENINSSIVERAWSDYRKYGAVFSLHEEGSTYEATSYAFGIVSEETTKRFRIYNNGNALLTIKSMEVPSGFTGGLTEQTEIAAGESVTFDITLPAGTPGNYSGDVVITYLDRPATDAAATDKTFSLALSGTVIDASTWSCDFGTGSTTKEQFPEGCVARAGIYVEENSNTGNSIYGVTYNAQFITPLLHLKSGDTIQFDTKYKSSGATLKIYITKDRNSYDTPAFTLTPTSSYVTQTLTLSDIEDGDYYLVFLMPNVYLDNLTTPGKASVAYDLYFTPSDTDKSSDSLQRGETYSRTVDVIAPLSISAADYTMQLIANGEAVVTVDSKDMTADAKSTTAFSFKWTPEVERTTVFNTYAQATFTDGRTEKSTVCEVTVKYQPDFCFLTKGSSADASKWWKPNDVSTPANFGLTNESGSIKEYEIYNWGSAPLTVTSVTMPAGFSANVSSCTVAPKEWQDFVITFSATEPGDYSGDMVIKYLDMNGDEQSYTLAVSGKLLDTTKWYTDFTQSGDTWNKEYPAGTIHGKNIDGSNIGTSSEPIWALNCMQDEENMLISPKLHAEKSELIQLNARLYNNTDSWKDGYVKVYAAETREGLESDDSRTHLGTISGVSEDEETLVDGTVFKDFDFEVPTEGDYYIGFELGGRIQLHSIYGLTLLDVAHDLQLAGYSISSSSVQNNVKEMQINVRNFGMKAEQPGDYKVAAFVDGEKYTEVDGSVEIPLCDSYTADSTAVPIELRYPKVGTHPVYLQLTAGDVVLTTNPVDVVFAKETLSEEKQVGEPSGIESTSTKQPLNFNYYHTESLMFYTAEDLGLNGGDKISKLYVKGYNTNTDYKVSIKIAYAWVDDDLENFTWPSTSSMEAYDCSGMTVIKDVTEYTLPVVGSSSDPAEYISVELTEPLVYPAGKALKLYMYGEDTENQGKNYGMLMSTSTSTKSAMNHYYDNKARSWATIKKPVLYLNLTEDPTTLSGKVTDGGAAVSGAVVTLVSTDGDNVQYEGITDAAGAYSINVIQDTRSYDVTAKSGEKLDYVLDQLYTENSVQNFTLMPLVKVTADEDLLNDYEEAIVDFSLPIENGYNAVVLPIALTSDEANDLFGDGFEALVYNAASVENGVLHARFKHANVESGLSGGTPYIINATQDAEQMRYRGKEVTTTIWNTVDENMSFRGTFVAKAIADGDFLLTQDNFVKAAKSREAAMIAPYTAYIATSNAAVESVIWSVDDNYTTGIETINAESLGEDAVIYNLQGVRVKCPTPGIYILNGNKVAIKK